MIHNKIISILGTKAHAWTMSETLAEIKKRVHDNEFVQHVVVNVAKVVNMRNDTQLKESVEACDIVNIDGMGVVWGARFLGSEVPERVAGVDLFYNLLYLAETEGFSVYFLGAKEDVVSDVHRWAAQEHPQLKISGSHHGYFWDDEEAVVNAIRDSGADLLFVAITSPKKENFINKWKVELGVKFVMGVGGTFDVVAGRIKRAPLWIQKAGLEWLYRVLQEPGRMWKRYLITNSKFAWFLIREKLKG